MPQKTQTITVAGADVIELHAMAYGAFEKLNWNVKYAGENILVAYTPKKWNQSGDEIKTENSSNQLTITSKMIHGESFDMGGRNKKHIAEFLLAFEQVKTSATSQQLNTWNEKILVLKSETIKVAETETRQAEEVDKVMNLSKGNMYVTYAIIAINVLIFIGMVATGISLMDPTGIDIIKWGANYLHLTASGEWWRLITCVFVHIGIIHLALNMYALFMIGIYLEPMLGKVRFITAYLCTGIFASLASLWWHEPAVPSAGASGAIFGMYGVFLALLSTNLIPKHTRKSLLQSIGVFVVYNLVYGMQGGVDNAAHIGGLLSGIVVGYLYYLSLKQSGSKARWVVASLVMVAAIGAAYLYLGTAKSRVDISEKELVSNLANNDKYKDEQKFLDKYNEFIEMQNRAIAPFLDTSQTDTELQKKLEDITIPEWEKASLLVLEVKQYKLSDASKKKILHMEEYISLRKQEAAILNKMITEGETGNYQELNEVREKINASVNKLDN